MKLTWTLLLIVLLIAFVSCGRRPDGNYRYDQYLPTDTLVINCDSVFNETGYYVRLFTYDSRLENRYNAIFVFGQTISGGEERIYVDSLYSKVGQVSFMDINQDGTKDILIQHDSDVRSNWTYHLFLTDLRGRRLNRVRGFDQVRNPRVNTDAGIIESRVSSGTNYIEFYKLVNKDSIYKYDLLVYDTLDDK
ncbi:MAG TPA: hypothetical protein PLX35_14815 [Cyclobacteriaceae bacterium]|nr:hypothetical protein [Cyclobacteriaceae bacterium]